MEFEPQIELKGADGGMEVEGRDVAPGPSRQAAAPQLPDEEQAGPELLRTIKTIGINYKAFITFSHQYSFLIPLPGPSGLIQQCRPASATVPKPSQAISDSDSEEEEGLVSRLMPPSCLEQPASCTKGVAQHNMPRSRNQLSIQFLYSAKSHQSPQGALYYKVKALKELFHCVSLGC